MELNLLGCIEQGWSVSLAEQACSVLSLERLLEQVWNCSTHEQAGFAELVLFKNLRVDCMSRDMFMHLIQLQSLLFTCVQSLQSGDPV